MLKVKGKMELETHNVTGPSGFSYTFIRNQYVHVVNEKDKAFFKSNPNFECLESVTKTEKPEKTDETDPFKGDLE